MCLKSLIGGVTRKRYEVYPAKKPPLFVCISWSLKSLIPAKENGTKYSRVD